MLHSMNMHCFASISFIKTEIAIEIVFFFFGWNPDSVIARPKAVAIHPY